MRCRSVRAFAFALVTGAAWPAVLAANSGDEAFDRLRDPALAGVVSAFDAEKDSRQWSRTKAELVRLLESNSPQLKNLASWWVGAQPGLSYEERIAFWMGIRQVVPQEEGVTGAAREISRLRLKKLQRRERLEIYRAAMEKGSVALWEGAKLDRREAAGLAAFDGIDELRDEVARYVVDTPTMKGLRASALVALELRKGAENRDDAIALHLRRLEEMRPEEIARRTKGEEGFALANEALAAAVDEKKSPELRDRLARALTPAFEVCREEWSRSPDDVRPGTPACYALARTSLRNRAQQLAWEAEIEQKHMVRSVQVPPAAKN